MQGTQYVGLAEVVSRYGGVFSEWTLREKARRGEIPCLKLPGTKAYLFSPDWLAQWDNGAELERRDIRTKAGKGRIVKPVGVRAA